MEKSIRSVYIDLHNETLFVGSYVKVKVAVTPPLIFDDLDFIVSDVKGGKISFSREKTFNRDDPDIMLLVGSEPGLYQIKAVEKSSGDVLDEADFSVTTHWSDDNEGPSSWVSGDFELLGVSGASWGGGEYYEPENYNVSPIYGTRNVAILLVDTDSQRYNPQDVQIFRNRWENIVFNGSQINNKRYSVAHYYREVSYNNLDFKGEVFGPVNLPDSWDDYFDDKGKPKGHFWQTCITYGSSLIEYKHFKHVVCVVKSVDATMNKPKKSVWSHATSQVFLGKQFDFFALGMVAIKADGTPFELCTILSHELGHNINLGGDLYASDEHAPQIQAREMDSWDIMAHESTLPHPSLVHRMRMGWLPKSAIKLYNFQNNNWAVDDTVTLQALEIGKPNNNNNQYSGIEIRITPNWNYYFEYRASQNNQIGDQYLPINNRVLGTDVIYSDNPDIVRSRRPVMLLEKDEDGDGPILGEGQDYKEQDISQPNFPTDFTCKVLRTNDTSADVQIQYGLFDRPDPYIRPWHPPEYQSPDIEIRNARNQVDSKWANVPWEGHANTVVATVHNRAKLNAPNVEVDFKAYDYTLSSFGITVSYSLDSATNDVPADGAAEFRTIWQPPKTAHSCIKVNIKDYPHEASKGNNEASSNYTRFISSKASPPERKVLCSQVNNPFKKPAIIYIIVSKSTNPLFRTYLEYRWLRLQPSETRDVQLMFESVSENESSINANTREEDYEGEPPNNVSICTVAYVNEEPVFLGGGQVQVMTGWETKISYFVFDYPAVYGHVATVDSETRSLEGKIILTIKPDVAPEDYCISSVSPDGSFIINLSTYFSSMEDYCDIQAYYVPLDHHYADSESEVKRIYIDKKPA